MSKKFFKITFFVTLGIITLLTACNSVNNSKRNSEEVKHENVITTKIMYDVSIVNEMLADRSKANEYEWYWENLPTPDGENFIKKLLQDVEKGKIPIYEYDMSYTSTFDTLIEIPKNQLKNFLKDALVCKYDVIDTTQIPSVLVEKKVPLDYKNVKKLRFLEEWYIENNKPCKRVIAIAPLFYIFINGTEYPQARFWVKEIN